MYLQTCDFGLDYVKLENVYFTTIRPPEWIKDLKPGLIVFILKRKQFHTLARVKSFTEIKIKDIPFTVLKHETELFNWSLNCKKDFIGLMNHFYNPKHKFSYKSKVCLIQFERIPRGIY